MNAVLRNIATLGFIGYIPIAPGTFGSLAAMIFFLLFKPPALYHVIILLLIMPVGIVSSSRAEILLNQRDSGHIVIDEFCGYFLSVLFIPFSFWNGLAAFFLFRFFDILKPPPIRWLERTLPGGSGIVADDLMAGVYTNLVLQIWMRIT